ncbi:dickkopf-related protein 4 isoform X2 [Bos indicus x Bos taurus]|uniref:dickkopf-related protein 4 isoform X2 n=1 Tax=Bos indicus x Bos taurus TaxID=30522 RepID=UPI000F7D169F|nr:dickkopf-related protein 4 isoform X2 [Bos indicus x Bos taurus]
MVVVVLLGLGWLCAPLGALVLDSNYIKSSSGAQRARKGSQCVSDKDCSARKFCLQRYDEKPFCATCRGPRRRCQASTMCCPGTLCMNNFCTPVEEAAKGPEKGTDDKDDIDTEETIKHPTQGNSNTTKPQPRKSKSSILNMSDIGEKDVSEISTAGLDFAALIIIGPKSVNRCSWRDTSAPGGVTTTTLMLWISSSAVTVRPG